MWQDDIHQLSARRTREGLQGCALSGRVRSRDAQSENGSAGG